MQMFLFQEERGMRDNDIDISIRNIDLCFLPKENVFFKNF